MDFASENSFEKIVSAKTIKFHTKDVNQQHMHMLTILYFDFNSIYSINCNIALYKKINDTQC